MDEFQNLSSICKSLTKPLEIIRKSFGIVGLASFEATLGLKQEKQFQISSFLSPLSFKNTHLESTITLCIKKERLLLLK